MLILPRYKAPKFLTKLGLIRTERSPAADTLRELAERIFGDSLLTGKGRRQAVSDLLERAEKAEERTNLITARMRAFTDAGRPVPGHLREDMEDTFTEITEIDARAVVLRYILDGDRAIAPLAKRMEGLALVKMTNPQ